MIYSESSQTVYSNVVNEQVFSVEENNYATIAIQLRVKEDNTGRTTESEEYRTIES